MSSVEVEARILSALLSHEELCWWCQEVLNSDEDGDSDGHVMTPCNLDREDTCGHLVHAACTSPIMSTGRYVDIPVDSAGDIFEVVWMTDCSICRRGFRGWASADTSLGKLA